MRDDGSANPVAHIGAYSDVRTVIGLTDPRAIHDSNADTIALAWADVQSPARLLFSISAGSVWAQRSERSSVTD